MAPRSEGLPSSIENSVEIICWQVEIMTSCSGGVRAVANALGWRTQRRRKHSSASLEEAAELVRAYLEALPKGSPARKRMPRHTELMECGRHDVRYAMQVRISTDVLPSGHGVPACQFQLLSFADVASMCMFDWVLHVFVSAHADR